MKPQLRTIIAGSRGLTEPDLIDEAVDACPWFPRVVLCGGARGIDTLGRRWAESLRIPVEMYRAQWEKYGPGAGPLRNYIMARHAEALIAIWDGDSAGTEDMIGKARMLGLKVFVVTVTKEKAHGSAEE